MLVKPTIDELEERVGNRHILAILVGKRARDLAKGSLPIGEEPDYNIVSQAANEIADGIITFKDEKGSV